MIIFRVTEDDILNTISSLKDGTSSLDFYDPSVGLLKHDVFLIVLSFADVISECFGSDSQLISRVTLVYKEAKYYQWFQQLLPGFCGSSL